MFNVKDRISKATIGELDALAQQIQELKSATEIREAVENFVGLEAGE
jgi:phosphoenolpyruvate-protein kinase (PTS system EI component)